MFEKYTIRVKQIINKYAQQEARRFGHTQIIPEHIFLGILREGEGLAVRILEDLGVDIEFLKEEIENNLPKYNDTVLVTLPELELSPAAKEFLKLAELEAKELGHSYVGTEHLLLGIMRFKNSIVADILLSEGKTIEVIRDQLLKILSEEENDFPPPPDFFEPFNLKEKKSKNLGVLAKYSKDLTKLAENNELDPVIGREKEIERLIHILSRRTKNNPVLVGEPGVGKTAIVEGLARRIIEGKVPVNLLNKRIVMLDLAAIVAGTKYRGEFEERIKNIINEIERNENIIVFIDEIHTIIGAGSAEGSLDAANILKPSLAKGKIRCIGATTLDEYRKYIERDPALERRFQMILVDEPTIEETIEILKGIKSKYEEFHKVEYDDKALEVAVELASRYITDRFLPDKAIDIIDEAGSKVKILKNSKPEKLIEIENKIHKLNIEKSKLLSKQLYEEAGKRRDAIENLKIEYEKLKAEWMKNLKKEQFKVTEDVIYNIVSSWTKIPIERLAKSEMERLLSIEKELKKMVIGQDEAIEKLAKAIRRARTNIKDPRRPIGSFIFLGPSGVGKTHLAKSLAQFLFDDESHLVRIDMSDFMEKFSVSRLIGAPPGYVGYEEGGILTEKIRHQPYSVVLFDEIEKAHPDVFNILLQIMEEGELADNLGHIVNFRNTIIIMTSNLGAEEIQQDYNFGFDLANDKNVKTEKENKETESVIKKKLKNFFRPEFLNRVDDIIVFKPLDEKSLLKIVDLLISEVEERLSNYNIKLKLSLSAKKFLIQKGYNKIYGARPLRRAIEQYIEDQLATLILKEKLKENSIVNIKCINNALLFSLPSQKKLVYAK